MKQCNFPEWSGEEVEYFEPTRVIRSYGYDVFANPISDESMQYNNEIFKCVLNIEGEVAAEKLEYPGNIIVEL